MRDPEPTPNLDQGFAEIDRMMRRPRYPQNYPQKEEPVEDAPTHRKARPQTKREKRKKKRASRRG